MATKTPSSAALDALFDEDDPLAESLRERYGRTTLWRWRKGRAAPSAPEAGHIERLTGGRVAANGWSTGVRG